MSEGFYKRNSTDFFKGKKVISLRKLRNGWSELPAGTVFTIEDKSGGFSLQSDPCKCCGVRVYIRKVHPSAVDIVEA